MIPQKNLSMLANRLLKENGGQRIQEQILERDYCVSWFLAGLDNSDLKNKLVFKGGTALKKCYFLDYRFSEDMDFTMKEDNNFDQIRQGFNLIFENVQKASGIRMEFSRPDPDSHRNSHTFYIFYDGPLPKTKPRELKTDITIKEKIITPVETRQLLSYGEYEDMPKASVISYSLEEIAVEKICALFDKARNEPRDLYDIWYLLKDRHIESGDLKSGVEAKMKFKEKDFIAGGKEFIEKEARLRKLWEKRLAVQTANMPMFDEVYRLVKRELKKASLIE